MWDPLGQLSTESLSVERKKRIMSGGKDVRTEDVNRWVVVWLLIYKSNFQRSEVESTSLESKLCKAPRHTRHNQATNIGQTEILVMRKATYKDTGIDFLFYFFTLCRQVSSGAHTRLMSRARPHCTLEISYFILKPVVVMVGSLSPHSLCHTHTQERDMPIWMTIWNQVSKSYKVIFNSWTQDAGF